jgi:hypothetical protein
MINGTYQIVMKTSMGKKYGRLTLYEKEEGLSGAFDILGHVHQILDGLLNNGSCRFSGEFITPVRNIAYWAEGSVDEKRVYLLVHTDSNEMSISGEIENTITKR